MKINYQFILAFDSGIYWKQFNLKKSTDALIGERCFGHDAVVLYLLNHPNEQPNFSYFKILNLAEKLFGIKISGDRGQYIKDMQITDRDGE